MYKWFVCLLTLQGVWNTLLFWYGLWGYWRKKPKTRQRKSTFSLRGQWNTCTVKAWRVEHVLELSYLILISLLYFYLKNATVLWIEFIFVFLLKYFVLSIYMIFPLCCEGTRVGFDLTSLHVCPLILKPGTNIVSFGWCHWFWLFSFEKWTETNISIKILLFCFTV